MHRGLHFKNGALLCGALFAAIALQAKAVELEELPFAVICEAPSGVAFVGYLSRVNPDGTAVYSTVLGRMFGQVDASGLIQMSDLVAGGGSCDGRTIDELRAAGQTRDFHE